jgi:hypothetical protein
MLLDDKNDVLHRQRLGLWGRDQPTGRRKAPPNDTLSVIRGAAEGDLAFGSSALRRLHD